MSRRWITGLIGSALCLASWSGCASAPPRAHGMSVVYAREDRVYVAAADSLRPADGDPLAFSAGGRIVATGVVTGAYGADLAAVRLTSGSLRGVKRLDRLRVQARNPRFAAPPVLHVGLPGPHRANLLFGCPDMAVVGPAAMGTAAPDRLGDRVYRLVRASRLPVHAPTWPDTLLVRLFDEPTDEEIALERGELDVAVFWPGELSPHIREQSRWREFLSGTRTEGMLAAIQLDRSSPDGGSLPEGILEKLVALNDGLFRGDLARFEEPPGVDAHVATGAPRSESTRFEVDHACPGWDVMERYLNRETSPGAPGYGGLRIRVTYLGAPSDAWSSLRDSLHVVPLFAVRCPVVSAPELRPYIRSIGADALVNMLVCRPVHRE
jgi:hypothetical protein